MFPVLLVIAFIFAAVVFFVFGGIAGFALYEIIEYNLDALDIAILILAFVGMLVCGKMLYHLIKNRKNSDDT